MAGTYPNKPPKNVCDDLYFFSAWSKNSLAFFSCGVGGIEGVGAALDPFPPPPPSGWTGADSLGCVVGGARGPELGFSVGGCELSGSVSVASGGATSGSPSDMTAAIYIQDNIHRCQSRAIAIHVCVYIIHTCVQVFPSLPKRF